MKTLSYDHTCQFGESTHIDDSHIKYVTVNDLMMFLLPFEMRALYRTRRWRVVTKKEKQRIQQLINDWEKDTDSFYVPMSHHQNGIYLGVSGIVKVTWPRCLSKLVEKRLFQEVRNVQRLERLSVVKRDRAWVRKLPVMIRRIKKDYRQEFEAIQKTGKAIFRQGYGDGPMYSVKEKS